MDGETWAARVRDIAGAFAPGGDGAEGVRYLVVGSVASVLQGCEFAPNDLDLIFPDRAHLERGVERLADAGLLGERDDIHTEAFGNGFCWHISRSTLADGADLDLVFLESGGGIADSDDGGGIWEGGTLIWDRHHLVGVGGPLAPVAPLLVQFESQVRRERPDRAAEIKRVLLRTGYSIREFRESLSAASAALFPTL